MASPRMSVSPMLGSPATACIKAVCIKVHDAVDEFQLNLKVGDVVYVLEQDASGWWGGYLAGQENTAWFPGGCVEVVSADESFEQGSGIMLGQKDFGNVNTTGPETESPSPIRKTTAVASPQRRGSLYSPNSLIQAMEFQPHFTPQSQGNSESQPTQLVQVAQRSAAEELLLQEQRNREEMEQLMDNMKQELEKERQERRRSQSLVDQLEFSLSMEQEAKKKIADEKKSIEDEKKRMEHENQRIQSQYESTKREKDEKTHIIYAKDVEIKQLQEQLRRCSLDSLARPSGSPCGSPLNKSLNASMELWGTTPPHEKASKARAASANVLRSFSVASFAPIAASRTEVAPRVLDEEPPRGYVAEKVRTFEQSRQRNNTPVREGLPLHVGPSTRELRQAPPMPKGPSSSNSAATGPVIPPLAIGRVQALASSGASPGGPFSFGMEKIQRPAPRA